MYFFFFIIIFSCKSKPIPIEDWKCPVKATCDKEERILLKKMWENRDPNYVVRSKHKNKKHEDPLFINILFAETSTYLRQHAHNPVNWHSWNPETLQKAKDLKKPIFLSVGYSTCHWCHVMEEESFENIEIASYLNEHYIPIKIDREERPDIDAVYMQSVYSVTGRGGWPMSVWLNEQAEPFYAETYIPPFDGDRGRKMGFLSLLQEMNVVYQTEPE